MTSDGWVWWAVGLLVFSLALLFALSPAMLGDSSRFILTIRLAGLLGVTLLVTWIGVGRRRADAARNELLARERTARTEAEAASRSKEEFFATISHELRGPLNAIVGWVRLLRTGKLDEETAICALETVERNARSQAHLIGELLDVSRIIAGKVRLDVRPVELATIIEEAAESVRPAAEGRSIEVETRLAPAAATVAGDPDRLQQVVENLFSNAIKFTPRGGRVTVRLAYDEKHATIIMGDTGQGIRADLLPHVFDRFRQADGTAIRFGGLGLGLAIVRDLVELHGGTVSAASEGEGQGANFTVTLPISAAGNGDNSVITPSAVRPPPRMSDGTTNGEEKSWNKVTTS